MYLTILLSHRVDFNRKLDLDAEPGPEAKQSDMECKDPKWCHNYCAKCLPFRLASSGTQLFGTS